MMLSSQGVGLSLQSEGVIAGEGGGGCRRRRFRPALIFGEGVVAGLSSVVVGSGVVVSD